MYTTDEEKYLKIQQYGRVAKKQSQESYKKLSLKIEDFSHWGSLVGPQGQLPQVQNWCVCAQNF